MRTQDFHVFLHKGMKMRNSIGIAAILCVLIISALFITRPAESQAPNTLKDDLRDPREKHLTNIKQLTNEGENAEAYFSPDGQKLIFQRAVKSDGCDQIFSMNLDGSDMKMLSNGEGK